MFVDNREPVNRANNRRMNELAMNSKYLDFFANELIPAIQAQYPGKGLKPKAAQLSVPLWVG
jgi:enterochelin esterase-like enzyme